MIEGVSVSHYDRVDWPAVAGSGRKFAIAKALEGETKYDPKFDSHRIGAKSCGMAFGSYLFAHPSFDPETQARAYYKIVGDLGANELNPCIDIETTDAQSVDHVKDWLLDCVTVTEELFRRPVIIYTGFSFWRDTMRNLLVTPLSTRKLWIARYGLTRPDGLSTWPKWTIWQYAADGLGAKVDLEPVPGIGYTAEKNRLDGALSDVGVTLPSN